MATIRWPAGKDSWEVPGLQGRAVGGDQACRGGQLGVTRPSEEGSWGQLGLQGRAVGGEPRLQGRAVRGDQPCRGGQLRENRLAGEQLGINQSVKGVDRG